MLIIAFNIVTSKRAKASQTLAQRAPSHVNHLINQGKQCRTQSTGILLKLLILTPRKLIRAISHTTTARIMTCYRTLSITRVILHRILQTPLQT